MDSGLATWRWRPGMTEPNFADGVARMNPLYFTAVRENQDRILPAVSAAGLGTGSKGCSGCGPGSSGAWVGNPSGRSAAVSDGLNVVSVANWAAALGEGWPARFMPRTIRFGPLTASSPKPGCRYRR